jgi:hypothetical protein
VLKRAGKKKVYLLVEAKAVVAVNMKNIALNFIAKLVVKEAVLAGEKRKKKVMEERAA